MSTLPRAFAIFNGGNALAMGIAVPSGRYPGRHVADRHLLHVGFNQTRIVIPLLMAAIAGRLILVGRSLLAVAARLTLWGGLATAAPVGWRAWVARTLLHAGEEGGGAVVQLAIAPGSTPGGIAFDSGGWQSTFALSRVLLISAAALVFITSRKTQE